MTPTLKPASTPFEAFERYQSVLAKTLRCVTNAHIVNNINPRPNATLRFSFTNNPAALNQSDLDLFFVQTISIVEDVRFEGCWKVKTLAYEYAIERRSDKQELLAFHWEGHEARNPTPHMHIGFAASQVSPFNNKTHIPSGRVFAEDIAGFLIKELGVKSRDENWEELLQWAKDLVMRFKTW